MRLRFPLGSSLLSCLLPALVLVAGCAPLPALGSRRAALPPAESAQAQPRDAGAPAGDEPAFEAVDPQTLLQDVGELDALPTSAPTATPLPTNTPLPTPTRPPTSTPDPLAAAGAPIRLQIPAIGVDALIERVGLTPDSAMDVPSHWDNVGWYMLGSRPGEAGNAVLAGHLDNSSGGPAVFWSLDVLAPGDEVVVTYESGDQFTFMVQDSARYEHNAEGPVIDRVFGDAPTANLNLITCQGVWDRNQATYSERLVVFTTLLPERTVRAGEVGGGAYD